MNLTNREYMLMSLAFCVGMKVRGWILKQTIKDLNEQWENIHQDVALQMGALTAIMSLLDDGQVEEAINFWNEHITFMQQIDNF
jgi:hypothetical protein